MNGEIANPFRARLERPIRASWQPHEVAGQESNRTERVDQRPAAGDNEHQDIEIRPTMRFDLPTRSQADDIGIELALGHVQFPCGSGVVGPGELVRIAEHARQVGGRSADTYPPCLWTGFEVVPCEPAGVIALELVTQMFRLVVGHDRERATDLELTEPLEDQRMALRLRDGTHVDFVVAHALSL